MRTVNFGLVFLCVAFPGALARLASGNGKDSMQLGIPIRPSEQDAGDNVDELQDPLTTETPTADPSDPPAPEPTDPPASATSEEPAPVATPPTNPIIENITWVGSGCPSRESENETASVTVELEQDGSFGVYRFNNFDVYLGWSETEEIETEAECMLTMDLVGIPEGWSFQIGGVQAEGYIYLEQGAMAVFNSSVFWSGGDDEVYESGKYWPNDEETPVDQFYLTDPLLLTPEDQSLFGSVCTAAGDGAGSGTLNINFRLSMQSDVEPAPNGIVTITALGITNMLVECEAPEPSPVTRCKKRKKRDI